jgi:phage baseplate assembly protein W
MAKVITPHFDFPFRRSGSGRSAVYVEQDSDEEVMDCVEVLLRTPVGSREEIPDYGTPDYVFRQGGVEISDLTGTIEHWEPRAGALLETDGIVNMAQTVRIRMRGQGRING